MRKYELTCNDFTAWVQCDSDYVILECDPIVDMFLHKPLEWLTRWMIELGNFDIVRVA